MITEQEKYDALINHFATENDRLREENKSLRAENKSLEDCMKMAYDYLVDDMQTTARALLSYPGTEEYDQIKRMYGLKIDEEKESKTMAGSEPHVDENGCYVPQMGEGIDSFNRDWEEKLKQAVLAEREACAQIADGYASIWDGGKVALDIRARGEKE